MKKVVLLIFSLIIIIALALPFSIVFATTSPGTTTYFITLPTPQAVGSIQIFAEGEYARLELDDSNDVSLYSKIITEGGSVGLNTSINPNVLEPKLVKYMEVDVRPGGKITSIDFYTLPGKQGTKQSVSDISTIDPNPLVVTPTPDVPINELSWNQGLIYSKPINYLMGQNILTGGNQNYLPTDGDPTSSVVFSSGVNFYVDLGADYDIKSYRSLLDSYSNVIIHFYKSDKSNVYNGPINANSDLVPIDYQKVRYVSIYNSGASNRVYEFQLNQNPIPTPTPEPSPSATPTPSPTATQDQTGDRAILTITLINGTEKEYDLPIAEVNAFLTWYDARDAGRGTGLYAIDKHTNNKGPFGKRKDYVIFDKILTFEVSEYTAE